LLYLYFERLVDLEEDLRNNFEKLGIHIFHRKVREAKVAYEILLTRRTLLHFIGMGRAYCEIAALDSAKIYIKKSI